MATYRWAIRAYPDLYRQEHGEELVATAVEMTESRWSIRQSASFVVEGLTMRAEEAAGGSRSQAWAKGMSLGITIWLLGGVCCIHLAVNVWVARDRRPGRCRRVRW